MLEAPGRWEPLITARRSGGSAHPSGSVPLEYQLLVSPSKSGLACTTRLAPTDAQTITLVLKGSSSVSSMSGVRSRNLCETSCDQRGCRCLADVTDLSLVDHVTVREAEDEGLIGCFCGEFAHILPVTIISSASLLLTLNLASSSEPLAPRELSEPLLRGEPLRISASYAFHNEETCGPRRVSSPLGSLESPMALSPKSSYYPSSTYFHQHCQWFFDPPQSQMLVLEISTMQKGVDCTTWNATIAKWDPSAPNQIGDSIDRFCPEIISKEYALNTANRKIVIILRSVSALPIHYRISWQSRGPITRNSVLSAGSKENIGLFRPTSASQSQAPASLLCMLLVVVQPVVLLKLSN